MSRDVKAVVTGLGQDFERERPIVELTLTLSDDAYARLRLGMTVTLNIPEAKQ